MELEGVRRHVDRQAEAVEARPRPPATVRAPTSSSSGHGGVAVRPAIGTGLIETTRIRRAMGPVGPAGPVPSPAPKIRRRESGSIIRRLISDADWNGTVTPTLTRGAKVTVWRPDGKPITLQQPGNVVQGKGGTQAAFNDLTAANITQIKNTCSLTPTHLGQAATFNAQENPGQGFKVTGYGNEPLSMVHHTESTGEGVDKNPHLTVENAHVLMFEDLFAGPGRDVRSKEELNKASINTALGTYGLASIDNLNFYESPSAGGKARTPHEQLSLSMYLAFITEALAQAGAPPGYATKITEFVTQMAQTKALRPAELFMRAEMDEPAFVRAVLAIDDLLPAGNKLPIAAATRKVFEKYWNVQNNEGKVPFLPPPDNKAGDATLRSGMQYEGSSFSKIEGQYAQEHFAEFVTAINTFTPGNAAIAATPMPAKAKPNNNKKKKK